MIAKQAASVHTISDGRMVLGIAVGGRQDDYEASKAEFEGRGETFEQQLAEIKRIWDGVRCILRFARAHGIGPDVSDRHPQLIVGGQIDATFRRAAEYGDGWIMGGGTPDMFAEGREKLDRAWSEAGREGKPHAMSLAYFSLGDDAEANAERYLGDYYDWLGEYAGQIVASAATDADTVKAYAQGFEQAGCDELVFMPELLGSRSRSTCSPRRRCEAAASSLLPRSPAVALAAPRPAAGEARRTSSSSSTREDYEMIGRHHNVYATLKGEAERVTARSGKHKSNGRFSGRRRTAVVLELPRPRLRPHGCSTTCMPTAPRQ